MAILANRRTSIIAILGLAVAAAVLAVTYNGGETAAAAPIDSSIVCYDNGGSQTFNLEARSGYIAMPDGNALFMWGYVPADFEPDEFQFPGPNLCVTEDLEIEIILTNTLPESTSMVFPGQLGVAHSGDVPGLFTSEAAPLTGTATYTFTPSEPGTYLYESGTDQVKQIQMGLFGGLVVRPLSPGPNYAYDQLDTQFDPDYEFLLLFHEIDPVLHQLVETGADPTTWIPTDRDNRYFTINGRSFPDTIAPNGATWLPNQPYSSLVRTVADMSPGSLVRYGNAGLDNHPFHPHGNHMTLIGQDGRSYGTRTAATFTKTVATGSTYDLLAEWHDLEAWQASAVALPVEIPGLEDLVFKDGFSFYSGSPFLGDTGPFPTGVTTATQCGEYYFPWHSHALDEEQNFDEGFGGMLTLWRVDPPPSVAASYGESCAP